MNFKHIFCITVTLSVIFPEIASAQQESAGDIIVTARKRQESILNVPVVETALQRAQIEQRVTTDLRDVAKLVPGLKLANSAGSIGTQVSLRGVGTSAANSAIDASVSLNVDGLQITQGLAYASAVFDLAQVEVLKGPQALFYGKNSPGGVIAMHTADPSDEFEVIGRLGHDFGANADREELIISGPVSSTLKLRFAGLYETAGGYFHNTAIAAPGLGSLNAVDGTSPDTRSYVVRGTALWTPTPDFTARLKANFWGVNNDGDQQQFFSCPEGVGRAPAGVLFLGGNEDCKLNRNTTVTQLDPSAYGNAFSGPNEQYVHTYGRYGSLDLTYRPRPDLSITSTTGYFYIHTSALSIIPSSYAGSSFLPYARPLKRHDLTEEIRANSDFSGPFNFTVGGFYQSGTLNSRTDVITNQRLPIALPLYLARYQQIVDIESISGFAQVRYKIVPQVELAAGARYTHETRNLTAFNWASGSPVLYPTATPKISSDNLSPEFTATYKPTDDVTLFASYKKAYKSGSFTLTTLPAVAAGSPRPDFSFGDEKVEGAEAGVKARLLDRSLIASLAFYDYRYKGLQVGALVPVISGVPPQRTLNAGSSKVYGVDFDISYLPRQIEGLSLHASVEWNHARFEKLDGVPCTGGQTIAQGCNQIPNLAGTAASLDPATGRPLFTAQSLDGKPLVRAPDWQATFGFDYELPVGRNTKLVLSNQNEYSSRYLVALGLRPDFYQPAYFKSDVSATLKDADDRWEFAIVAKNIGGRITTGNCLNTNSENGNIFPGQITGGVGSGPPGGDELACFADSGREIWLRVTLRPFG